MQGVWEGRGGDKNTGLSSGSQGPPKAGDLERGPRLGDTAIFSGRDGGPWGLSKVADLLVSLVWPESCRGARGCC